MDIGYLYINELIFSLFFSFLARIKFPRKCLHYRFVVLCLCWTSRVLKGIHSYAKRLDFRLFDSHTRIKYTCNFCHTMYSLSLIHICDKINWQMEFFYSMIEIHENRRKKNMLQTIENRIHFGRHFTKFILKTDDLSLSQFIHAHA